MKPLRNALQSGDLITVTAPYAVSAGDGVLVGDIFGTAAKSAAAGQSVVLETGAVFELAAKTGEAAAIGATAYWDDTARKVTTSSTSYQIGAFADAKLSADTEARVVCRRTVGAVSGGSIAVGADVTINSANAATYNGKTLIFSGAYTVTLAAGLPTDFGFAARPPASGNASIASANTGGLPTLDGATTTVTRALASNKLFAVTWIAADAYTVTGS